MENTEQLRGRIEQLVKDSGLSVMAFAAHAGVDQSSFHKVLKGKLGVSSKMIERIANSYGVDPSWLAYGGDDANAVVDDLRPRYDLAAFAGTLSEYVDDTCEMTRKITQLPKYDFTIRITGDSMEPEYKSGDEVACMRVEKGDFLQWGKVYVLNTSQGAVIKRLFKGENGYRCVSDNKMYNDFEVKESDVYSINLVVGLLRIC